MKKSSTFGFVVAMGALVMWANGCGTGGGTAEFTDERGEHYTADGCAKLVDNNVGEENAEFGLVATVDYAMVKAQVLTGSCTSACHAPGKTKADIDLSTYAGAKANIVASIADVKGGGMPIGGIPLLSPAQIALMEAWQAGGLIENGTVVPGVTPTPVGTTGGAGSTTGSASTGGTTSATTGGTTTAKSSNSTTKPAQCLQ